MPRAKNNDNKPKGRMSAYAFFVQYCREQHKIHQPDEAVIFAEFSKKCADKWKEMDEKDKQPFFELADKDKARYHNEMKDYDGPMTKGKKKKQKKDPNAPKRALSAFFWYCNDERPKVRSEFPNMTIGEMAKEMAHRWGSLMPEVKSKFDELSKKDKLRYEEEMKTFRSTPVAPSSPVDNFKQDSQTPSQNSMMNYASNSNFPSHSNYGQSAAMNYGMNANYGMAAAAAAANPNYMAYQNYAAANVNYMANANYAAALQQNSNFGLMGQHENGNDEDDDGEDTE